MRDLVARLLLRSPAWSYAAKSCQFSTSQKAEVLASAPAEIARGWDRTWQWRGSSRQPGDSKRQQRRWRPQLLRREASRQPGEQEEEVKCSCGRTFEPGTKHSFCDACGAWRPEERQPAPQRHARSAARWQRHHQPKPLDQRQPRAASIFDRLDQGRRSGAPPSRHGALPEAGVYGPGMGEGPEDEDRPGFGSRRCLIAAWRLTQQHMRGVDTTRLPMGKIEQAARDTWNRAPDAKTDPNAPGDVESKDVTKRMSRRPRRQGAVTIPALR